MSDGTPGGSGRGLRGALTELGASLLGLAHTRLELAAVEFDEVIERTVARLVLLLVALMSFAFALLAASTLFVVIFWDTHPIAALCAVESTISVNSTVASTRSNSISSSRMRRANRSTLSITVSAASQNSVWSSNGSSTSVDPLMRSAMYRAFSIGSTGLSIACKTRVGTWIVGRTARTSLSRTIRSSAIIVPGLPAARKYLANRSMAASSKGWFGAKKRRCFSACASVPHPASSPARYGSHSASVQPHGRSGAH